MVCPIICVHGIWDSAARLQPLVRGLGAQGLSPVHAFDLVPRNGSASIEALAGQVSREVARARRTYASAQVDLVGFSMGALTSRYFVQRLGGKDSVRRFISIAGPHAGTWTAYGLPWPGFVGVRQMRPGSALLRQLALDDDPFGAVEVHCIYTPLDIMIIPPRSGILPGAQSVTAIPVASHRLLLSDRRVHARVARILAPA